MNQFIYKTIVIITCFLLFFMGLAAFDFLEIKNNYFIFKLISLGFYTGLILTVSYFINRPKVSMNVFIIGLLLVSFGIRLWFIIKNDPKQVSDFSVMYKTAVELANGNQDALKKTYFDFAIYNAPFTIYQAIVLKFKESIFLLKFLSIIYSTLIVLFVYLIGRKIHNESSGRIAGLICCFFPPLFVYNTILTNQTLSILFILVGIYCVLNNKRLILAGLFLGLGQIFRPIGIIFLFATIVLLFWEWLNYSDYFSREKIKRLFFNTFKLMVPYYLILFVTSSLMVKLNFTEHSLFYNPTPSYKFLVGLNPESQGGYSQSDNNLIYQNIHDFESVAQQKINERTDNLLDVYGLFETKFKHLWGKKDTSFYWSKLEFSSYVEYSQLIWVVLLFGGCSIVFFKREKTLNPSLLYILLPIAFFTLIYLFIEIQPRYRYELYPLFILTTGVVFSESLTNLKNNISTKKILIFLMGISLLYGVTRISNNFYQRTVEKESLTLSSPLIYDVHQTLNKHLEIEKIYIKDVGNNHKNIVFEVNEATSAKKIKKYALTLRAGLTEEQKAIYGKDEILWDFKPILYKSGKFKYIETTVDANELDSLSYLRFALYDRDGFNGFKSDYIKIENIRLNEL